MSQSGSITLVPKNPNPIPEIGDEWLIVTALAEKHKRDANTQNEQYKRTMDRVIRNAKKRRGLTDREAFEAFRKEYETTVRGIHGQAWATMLESDETMVRVMAEHKDDVVQAFGEDEEVMHMQAETWAVGCMLCRAKDWTASGGVRVGAREHDWRACRRHGEDVAAVRVEVEAVIGHHKEWEDWPGPSGWPCGGCGQGREVCWMRGEAGRVFRTGGGECRLRGVMAESVGVLLAVGPQRLRDWERREGRPLGAGDRSDGHGADRFGYRAVGRVWQRWGWLGSIDMENVRIDEVRDRYREALVTMTGRQ